MLHISDAFSKITDMQECGTRTYVGVGWGYYRDVCCVGALNQFQCFPGVCPLARGAKAGIRLPLPMGLALAPTDQDCLSLAPPTTLPCAGCVLWATAVLREFCLQPSLPMR